MYGESFWISINDDGVSHILVDFALNMNDPAWLTHPISTRQMLWNDSDG